MVVLLKTPASVFKMLCKPGADAINIAVVNFINILHGCFLYKSALSKPKVTREKLPKRLLYKKGARKMLMKLTPGFLV